MSLRVHRLDLRITRETLDTINRICDSLMKSKTWVVENSIYNYAASVNNLLAIDEEFRDFIRIKKERWMDDLRSDMLKYHLSKGFLLKNSVKKIFQMVTAGVDNEHILKAIGVYQKLTDNPNYLNIIDDIKNSIIKGKIITEMGLRNRLEALGKDELTLINTEDKYVFKR